MASEGTVKSYVYQNETERRVLLTALHLHEVLANDAVTPLAAYTHSNTDFSTGPDADIGVALTAADQNILRAYGEFDIGGLKTIQSDAIKARSKKEAALRQMDADKKAFLDDRDIYRYTVILNDVRGAIAQLTTPPNDLLIALTDFTPAQWEAKRITDLNKKIDARLRAVRATELKSGGGDPELTDQPLQRLYRQKAAILGQLSQYDQVAQLRRVSASDPAKFKIALDEETVLLQQLAQAEAALTVAAAAPKSDDASVAEFLLPAPGVSVGDAWIKEQVRGKPLYVVVLRPVTDLKAPPSDSAKGGGSNGTTAPPVNGVSDNLADHPAFGGPTPQTPPPTQPNSKGPQQ
jgi:hypothetical protein